MDDKFRLERVIAPHHVPAIRKVPELIRVPAIDPLRGVIVSECIFALNTHFVAGRTIICGGRDNCEHCSKVSLKWYGLVALLPLHVDAVKWVQLTPPAAQSLLQQVMAAQVEFFKCGVCIRRRGKKINSPVIVDLDEHTSYRMSSIKPQTPEATIERVFGSRDSTRKNGRPAV